MGVLKYEFHAKCLRKQQHTLTQIYTQPYIKYTWGRVSVVVMQLHFLRREKSKGGYVESGRREDGGQKSLVVFSDSEHDMEKQTK